MNMQRTVIIAALCAIFSAGFAQDTPEFTHTIISSKATQLPAKDFWFTMPRNYENQSGKYYEVYVASPKATTVNIQVVGGTAAKRTLAPREVWAFKIPLAWEVTSSGIVEYLGIGVWSDNADLNVNMLSRNPATSDGMNIIPVSAWGTEYVVAAYHALFEGVGITYDYPSEFSVIAAYDSTVVKIKTSADLRKNGLKNDILHARGDTFSIMLHRGQVVQYMTSEAQNANDYDVTGTVITSSKPVGVVGASQCPNIPPEYPYCDHICEMIPPVNAWGNTYHSIPFYNRKGGDSFVMIASKDGQTIYFNGVPITSLMKFDYMFRPDIDAPGRWSSDAPFLLAQYINSTTWIDPTSGQDNNGVGDPAMVVLNPKEQYVKELLFQTPMITTGSGYTHYANIFVQKDVVSTTTLDGIPISSYPSISPLPVPFSNYVAFRARSLKSGSHLVKSDSGVGVYVYGYGSYDSYAWNGQLGYLPPSTDTIAPVVTSTAGDCHCAHVAVTDIDTNSTGLSNLIIDSIHNITFTTDSTFSSGASASYYDICILQPSDSGYISVSIYDNAGNRTTVTSRIASRIAPTISPASLSIAYAGTSIPNFGTFTLKNTTTSPLPLSGADGLRFANGSSGFSLFNPDLSDLAINASRTFTVRYLATDSLLRRDTIVLGNECNIAKLFLEGFYGGAVATTTGFNLDCILLGTQKEDSVIITNSGLFELRITSITIDDPAHFSVSIASLPVILHAGESFKFPVVYNANTLDTSCTTVRVTTDVLGELTAQVCGCALPQGSVRDGASNNESEFQEALRSGNAFAWLAPIPNPADRSSAIRFVFGLAKQSNVTLELFDLLGKRIDAVDAKTYDGGIHQISFDTRLVIAGTYIYRYSVNGKPCSGMLTVR